MTPVLDAVRREKLRKLAEAATPGERVCFSDEPKHRMGTYVVWLLKDGRPSAYVGGADKRTDAAYIAAMSPDTTLALLAYIAELEAGLTDIGRYSLSTEMSSDEYTDTTVADFIDMYNDVVLEARALLPKASVREERK